MIVFLFLVAVSFFQYTYCIKVLPSPPLIPKIGSLEFLYSSISNRIIPFLKRTENELGNIFLLKTGPIIQIWCSDVNKISDLYKKYECSGRSQIQDDSVFGGEFLFLVRDPDNAKTIKARQKSFLDKISTMTSVSNAVDTVNISEIISMTIQRTRTKPGSYSPSSSFPSSSIFDYSSKITNRNGDEIIWPSEVISFASFNALIELYLGSQPLTSEEISSLLAAVTGYRKRGLGIVMKMKEIIFNLIGSQDKKLNYAETITSLLSEAVRRSGVKEEDVLSLLVSATVGGSEIFPLLFQWIVLRLAVDVQTQDKLYQELRTLQSSGKKVSSGSLFSSCISACALDCPVSAAIGPPRKVIKDFEYEGYAFQKENLIFAMHPGLKKSPHIAIFEGEGKDFFDGDYKWPVDLNIEGVKSWPMFGIGTRSCCASQQSMNFLCAMLASLIKDYKWDVANKKDIKKMFLYKEDGSLLVPKENIKLRFTSRRLS